MTAAGEPDEIVGTGVNLLEKRRLGVDEATGSKYAVDFTHDHARVEDVLEDRLDDDGVDALAGERDLVRIGNELRHRTSADIEREDADVRSGIQRFDAIPDRPRADHEHQRRGSRQEREQFLDVRRGNAVQRLPPRAQRGRDGVDRPPTLRTSAVRSQIFGSNDATVEVDESRQSLEHRECAEDRELTGDGRAPE